MLKFSGKKYSFALHLVERDTDPDPDSPNDADLAKSGSQILAAAPL
jgi:hypothetical protein